MIALSIDGYTVAAIAIAGFVVVVLAVVATRMMRDHGVRVARIGLFIERERISQDKPAPQRPDSHQLEPGSEETAIKWPEREEDPL